MDALEEMDDIYNKMDPVIEKYSKQIILLVPITENKNNVEEDGISSPPIVPIVEVKEAEEDNNELSETKEEVVLSSSIRVERKSTDISQDELLLITEKYIAATELHHSQYDDLSTGHLHPLAPISILVTTNLPLLLHLKIHNEFPIVYGFDHNINDEVGMIEASGLVRIGDSLISCNGISFRNLPLLQVAELLRPPIDGSNRLLTFLRLPLLDDDDTKSKHLTRKFFSLEFDTILVCPILDESKIRTLCMRGIPEDKRPIYWRILLGYLPKETNRWAAFLQSQRDLYKEITSIYNIEELLDAPRTLENKSDDAAVLYSIQLDVIRTHPSLQFFIKESHTHDKSLLRILFAYAKYNFGVKYTQGMNEICAALYYVFACDKDIEWSKHAEADTYFCFVALMSEVRDMFLEKMDDTRYGLTGRIEQLSNILSRLDSKLYEHLMYQGVDTSFYGLRWITTLLSREFDLPDTMRLWDSLFSDVNMLEYTSYICATMVIEQRDFLLKNDFAANLQLLQSYPPIDVVYLLEKAAEFQEKDSKKTRKEIIVDFIDAAKENGKEVFENFMVNARLFLNSSKKTTDEIFYALTMDEPSTSSHDTYHHQQQQHRETTRNNTSPF